MRLLRVLNERQARDQTDVTVVPEEPDARLAGLGYRGSPEYNAAVQWLLDEGALRPADETGYHFGDLVGSSGFGLAFKITRHGLELLGEARR